MRFQLNPSKTLYPILLFYLDSEGPLHGDALTNLIKQKFNWKSSQIAIYNALKDSEIQNALISEEIVNSERVQEIYSISKLRKNKLNLQKKV